MGVAFELVEAAVVATEVGATEEGGATGVAVLAFGIFFITCGFWPIGPGSAGFG